MTQEALFTVSGMDCAACAARIEDALNALKGVHTASVNFATERLRLEYAPEIIEPETALRALKKLGYDAQPVGVPPQGDRAWWTRPKLILLALCGLLTAIGFLLELASAGEWWTKGAYGLAVLVGGYYPTLSGWRALRSLSPNIQTLLVAAAGGAVALDLLEEAAILVFIFSLGEVLEAYAVDKARGAIRALIALAPKEARVRRGDEELILPVEEIRIGDVVIVRPGEKIAMDGVVVVGRSAVDQAAITGESIPVTKGEGDEVFAGTINERGALDVEVTKLSADTTLAQIIHSVEEAQERKTRYQRFGDSFARIYTPAMFVLAILLATVPVLVFGEAFALWFYRGLVVLVVSCSCGLVLSVPVSVVTAIGRAAKMGVLIKGGVYLEAAAKVDVLVVDKTGTLTLGKPEVTDILPVGSMSPEKLLSLAAAIEKRSEHPLADAVLRKAAQNGAEAPEPEGFESFPGEGAAARLGTKTYRIGTRRLLSRLGIVSDQAAGQIERLQGEGKTVLLLADEDNLLGMIAVADRLRSDAREAIQAIKAAGVARIVMLTGDNEGTARSIAQAAGIDEYRAGLLPADKVEAVIRLKQRGLNVAMIGDGVNDAPALAAADIGIAMGVAGTDVAVEAEDAALMADDLSKVAFLLRLSRRAVHNIQQNFAASLLIVAFLVPAALFGWVGLVDGLLLNEGAALVVIANGLRLLRVA
ncbi:MULTISPECIES: heavy metal translocating P-type ATPase [Vibrio harveyi group]|uniref:heavy metal translocating P-type ATPase n=1 Tax=Vibrio campbellii TaxID=680 RepID=UPI001F074800|nr:cation-translocating P-type ATPase [Vibrio campbellii]UMM06729.1 cation-translocating P-type ATPase [Vibrio campbellii]